MQSFEAMQLLRRKSQSAMDARRRVWHLARGSRKEARLELESRAAALLRERAVPLVPLRALHRALMTQPDEEAVDAESLQRRLRARPDLFLVLERGSTLPGAENWPARDRIVYEEALRAAGCESGPLIGALPSADGAGQGGAGAVASARVAAALAELAASPGDGSLRARLPEALPLAEATMRALAEAFRAKLEGERSTPAATVG
jgi:hypothetical protein